MNTNKTTNTTPALDVISVRAIDLTDADLDLLESVGYIAPLARRLNRPTDLQLVEIDV